MAEILVNVVTRTHADPEKDFRGCWKKGYPVCVQEDGWPWGAEECLLKFVIVKIPGLAASAIQAKMAAWRRVLDFSVVSSNLPADAHRISVSANASGISAGGVGKVTRGMIEAFLSRWGASVVSVASNSVVFDVAIYNAIVSDGFWRTENVDDHVTFSEVSYTQATGVHRISASYSAALDSVLVEGRVLLAKGSVVSHDAVGRVIVFDVARSVVVAAFYADVKEKAEGMVSRCRYAFSAADVDAAVAAGGVVTLTAVQANNKLVDRLLS